MRTENRRKRLLTASLEMANEKNFSDLRISDITSRAGVAKGTFYTYFQSKDDCFRQASYEVAENLYDRLLSSNSNAAGNDVAKVGEMIYELAWKNRKLGRLFSHELLSEDKEFNNMFTTRNKNVYKELARTLSGEVSEEELEIKAYMVIGMIDALICEVFICENQDEELARQRFIKSFKTIITASID